MKISLHENIDKVFFRADSGFFSGGLFDLLESYGWDYLVKVKLKNLEVLLQKQNLRSETWIEQIKGQAMAGAKLTDNFWANDILWQSGVFDYNLSLMMR